MSNVSKVQSFAVPERVKATARRGLKEREKYGRGGLSTQEAGKQGIGSGVARASDLISGKVSLNTIKRMVSFFARQGKNYRPSQKDPDGGPTTGTIAYRLWGGQAGKAWAESVLRSQEKS